MSTTETTNSTDVTDVAEVIEYLRERMRSYVSQRDAYASEADLRRENRQYARAHELTEWAEWNRGVAAGLSIALDALEHGRMPR